MTLRERIHALYDRLVGKSDGKVNTSGANPLPALKIRAGKCTSIGYVRDNNEDRMLVDDKHRFYIVADGMGGQAAGEQASQLAVDLISEKLVSLPLDPVDESSVVQYLRDSVVSTNGAILAQGMADPNLQNMGTTIVLCVERLGKVFFAHVGDSRAYLFRDKQLIAVTTDHNLAQALFEAKTISKEELRTHRFRNVLWKYLGSKEAVEGPDLDAIDLESGDRIVLVTDGLTGVMDDSTLVAEVFKYDDPQKLADHLVQLSLDMGSKDNVTCVTLFVDNDH